MSTPHQGGRAGRARGLSEQLRDLERSSDAQLLPDFDLDAAVRGGQRRARRRTAASVAATAAAVAAVVTAVALGPLGGQPTDPGPAGPAPTASATASAPASTPTPTPSSPTTATTSTSASATTDTGYITAITPSGAASTTITVDRVTCDDAADRAEQAKSVDQELCLIPNPDPSAVAGPYLPPEDTHTSYQVALAPDPVVIGSASMQSVLDVPGGHDGTWFQQPMSQRHLGVADLRTFLGSAGAHNTVFRLHLDDLGEVDRITEVYHD